MILPFEFEGKNYHATSVDGGPSERHRDPQNRRGDTISCRSANRPSSLVATPVVAIGFPLDLPGVAQFRNDRRLRSKISWPLFLDHASAGQPSHATRRSGRARSSISKVKWSASSSAAWTTVRPATRCRSMPRKKFAATCALRRSAPWLDRYRRARGGRNRGRVACRDDANSGKHAGCGFGLATRRHFLQVGKIPVHQPEDVIDASFFISAGDTVPITVMRGDEKLTFTVQATSSEPEAMALGPARKSSVPLRLDTAPR